MPFIRTVITAALVFLSACGTTPTQPVVPNQTPTAAEPTAVPSPTSVPRRDLVICLGYEPQSLYLYGPLSAASWSVLDAIYDGPIDQVSYSLQPVLLEKIPALADGDANLQAVDVVAGDEVINTSGELATLTQGVEVFPSGCSSPECAITYDGTSSLQMDRLQAVFRLKPGIQWADGQPLQASDSVYSFQLASSPDTLGSKYSVDRTLSYRALDELQVEWTGIPGYLDPSFDNLFWSPLPKHAWQALNPEQLNSATESNRQPLGWGPYHIDEWVTGDHITLSKNPLYFRAAEGLPYFDKVVYRFLGTDSTENLKALEIGECDILDQTTSLEVDLAGVVQAQAEEKLQAFFTTGPEWEHLDFGIQPASYDDGFNLAAGDRLNVFGDARTRQAFAYCIDREAIARDLLQGLGTVPLTFLPPQDPLAAADAPAYPFDPQAGARLLDAVGWKHNDNNPTTPRNALGIAGVPDGTPLAVQYWTTQAPLRVQASQAISQSLAQCGISAVVNQVSPEELFRPGPEGRVFGRSFDLVQFTWDTGLMPLCRLYTSERIPRAENQWIGVNVSGYANPEFDAACQTSLFAPPGGETALQANLQAQVIFATDLPALPLYQRIRVSVANSGICGIVPDPGARSILWNLEQLRSGDACS